jgi:hypothetical protein
MRATVLAHLVLAASPSLLSLGTVATLARAAAAWEAPSLQKVRRAVVVPVLAGSEASGLEADASVAVPPIRSRPFGVRAAPPELRADRFNAAGSRNSCAARRRRPEAAADATTAPEPARAAAGRRAAGLQSWWRG